MINTNNNQTNSNLEGIRLYKAVTIKKFNNVSNNTEIWIGKRKDGSYLVLTYIMLKGTSQYMVLDETRAKSVAKTLRVNGKLVRDVRAESMFRDGLAARKAA